MPVGDFEAPAARVNAQAFAVAVDQRSAGHGFPLLGVREQFTEGRQQRAFADGDGEGRLRRVGSLVEGAGVFTVRGAFDAHGSCFLLWANGHLRVEAR